MKMFAFVSAILFSIQVVMANPPSSMPIVKNHSYTSFMPDQARCQQKANYMATNNIRGHVWSPAGRFEGVGFGSSPNCKTCTPSSNMSCTGDACAQGKNGIWYRVRAWR
jgi:hypothetical protein